ncbi:MAG: hypothetical protein Q9201_005852 [Fulgogasparrea decipioides]
MLRPLCYLKLLLLDIFFALSTSPSNADLQVRSPTGLSDVPFNLSALAVQPTNISVAAGRPIACFDEPSRAHEPLKIVKFMDCYTDVARGLLLGDEVMIRQIWTRVRLPFSWNAGTCQVILDAEDLSAWDYIQPAEIAHVASMITYFCVIAQEPHLAYGGVASIGNKGEFRVVVLGRTNPRVEDISES